MSYLTPPADFDGMDDLQRRVGEWGEQTFPYATTESILEHLKDEVDELWAARGTFTLLAREAADVALLLMHLAHRKGFSLQEVMEEKFALCQQRQWGPPDERGVSRHIEEGDPQP